MRTEIANSSGGELATGGGSRSQRRWRIALLGLVVVPFLPEIAFYATAGLAMLKGCAVEQKAACTIGPLSVADILANLLEAGLLIGGLFAFGGVVLWLGLCLVAVIGGWQRVWSRLLIGLAVSLVFAVLPYFAPMIAIGNFAHPQCQPNEGGVGPCVMFGDEVGSPAHESVVAGWFVFWGAPIAFAMLVIFAIVVIVLAVRGRRSAEAA